VALPHCRWLDFAGKWGLPKLEASCLDLIKAKRCGLLPGGGYAHGVLELGTNQPANVTSFRALLKSGRIDPDLEKLAPAVLVKVMKAAFTAPGCQGCMAPGNYDCMCPALASRNLAYCPQCKTRSKCGVCGGWLDV
jgi:hypothetical protein